MFNWCHFNNIDLFVHPIHFKEEKNGIKCIREGEGNKGTPGAVIGNGFPHTFCGKQASKQRANSKYGRVPLFLSLPFFSLSSRNTCTHTHSHTYTCSTYNVIISRSTINSFPPHDFISQQQKRNCLISNSWILLGIS